MNSLRLFPNTYIYKIQFIHYIAPHYIISYHNTPHHIIWYRSASNYITKYHITHSYHSIDSQIVPAQGLLQHVKFTKCMFVLENIKIYQTIQAMTNFGVMNNATVHSIQNCVLYWFPKSQGQATPKTWDINNFQRRLEMGHYFCFAQNIKACHCLSL